MSSALFCLLRIALGIQGHLYFHVNSKIVFSVSMKNNSGILLRLYFLVSYIVFLTLFI